MAEAGHGSLLLTFSIAGTAAGLRVFQLGRDELWFDEGFAALVALEPTKDLLGEVARDASPPLYYLLLRAWGFAVGTGPMALRLFSVLAGVLSVVLCAWLGRRVWNPAAGLLAAALLAVSPLHIHYSREVRPYSLFLVFVLVSFLALERLACANRCLDAAVALLATLAALYTHYYGLFLIPGLALWASVRRIPLRMVLACAALLALGYLPWAPVLANQMASGATAWVERIWLESPPAAAFVKSLAAFCIGGSTPPYVPLGSERLPGAVHWGAYALFAFLTSRALLSPANDRARLVALTLGLLLGPPFVLSFLRPVYVVGRHDLFALPLFLLVAARGMTLGGLMERSAVLLGAGTLAAASVAGYFTRPPIDGVRRQASVLLARAAPSDPILATGFTRNALEYYVRMGGGRQPFHSFPSSFGRHRGWVDEHELSEPDLLIQDANQLTAMLGAALAADGRLWIAHSRQLAPANDLLMARIARRLRQTACPGNGESVGFTCWRIPSFAVDPAVP